MISGRNGTVTEKPSFRTASAKRRAPISTDGCYKWQKNEDGTKTAYGLQKEDDNQLLGFEGLYAFWPNPTKTEDAENKSLVEAMMLARAARDELRRSHEQMSITILTTLWNQWQDPTMAERVLHRFANS